MTVKFTFNNKEFAERLRRARAIAGLSQAEAAKQSGTEASAWSHWESGRRVPSIQSLYKIASALGEYPWNLL